MSSSFWFRYPGEPSLYQTPATVFEVFPWLRVCVRMFVRGRSRIGLTWTAIGTWPTIQFQLSGIPVPGTAQGQREFSWTTPAAHWRNKGCRRPGSPKMPSVLWPRKAAWCIAYVLPSSFSAMAGQVERPLHVPE